ncbi:MAG: hypothetical protein AABY44_03620 [Nitrospirota bacterium]
MLIRTGYGDKFEDYGRVVLKDNIAVWDVDVEEHPHFLEVYYWNRTYTTKDGADYLNAFVKAFQRSSTVIIVLEEGDTWYDPNWKK